MGQIKKLQEKLTKLRLGETAHKLPFLLEKAEQDDETVATFLLSLLDYEQKKERKRR